ncbi:MAG TPA: alkaline phosphatase family protein [Thermoanaerobaculia bacterium]|nr:alkaline phosphatase family protein [Thermoanaerobaculia bacterium]
MLKRIAIIILIAVPLSAQQPDLIVVISVDQFRYEYLTRFAPYLSDGGFNRGIKHGANFTRALYPYAVTYTGPGHAAIGTGYVPARSGIVANTWLDRTTATPVYCAEDKRAIGGYSPLNLDSDSLGDRLQEKTASSKVIGVALKDRAAILMAGRKATAAYWFDPKMPGFTSSSYYHANRTMLNAFNTSVPAVLTQHREWIQSTFIPTADLAGLTHDPASLRKYKATHGNLGVEFPHPIATIDELTYTPFGNDLVLTFAERIIDDEHLGTDDASPDLLFVGLSSQDYLGHAFGPDSLEVADSVMRTDRQLEEFFNWLDQKFGGRYTVAITADHGVQSIPEVARDMGREAGRVDFQNPKKTATTFADLAPDRLQLEKLAAKMLGLTVTGKTPIANALVSYFEEPALYLNWARVSAAHLDSERVKRALRDAAKQIHGIRTAFTSSDLIAVNPQSSGIETAMRLSFRADRSGDVLVTLKAGYIWKYSSATGTTHGQAVDDDQHVPLLLFGRGITQGTWSDEVAPTFLAKTIGALASVDAGGTETRVLPCVK